MVTTRYILKDTQGRIYYVDAKDKRELKVKAYGQVPDGIYHVLKKDGSLKDVLKVDSKTSERASKARPKVSKEQYDQLYYYMDESQYRQTLKGADPLNYTSPRRYDDIQSVRKAALAKSKSEWTKMRDFPVFSYNTTSAMHVFKGRKYLGYVEYNVLKGKDNGIHDHYDGLWTSVDRPKDPSPMLSDGSLGARASKGTTRR